MSDRIKIGVTGTGGGVGQSIIKSLNDTKYECVGLDGELLGTGLYAVPTAYKIPYARSSEFIPTLLEICKEENIKILFPGLDAELKILAESKQIFSEIGTTVVVSSPEVIELSNDKLITYQKLTANGIAVPLTIEFSDYKEYLFEYPFIIKQRLDGARSKNVFLIKNKFELEKITSSSEFVSDDYVIQEYIEGDEYTCGSVNVDGLCYGVIVMRRILRDGDTYKCFSIRNSLIEEEVMRLMNLIQPFGACNVQLRLKQGKPYIFEINARCSGTTAARTLCGFNEPKMISDYISNGLLPKFEIQELSILRYWQELVVENNSISELKNNGRIISKMERRL
jgi:carbamoyl-phosphate synthase large subunit